MAQQRIQHQQRRQSRRDQGEAEDVSWPPPRYDPGYDGVAARADEVLAEHE